MLDVRKPIGYLFVILGLILVVFGFTQIPQAPTVFVLYGPQAFYLDIPWGGVMTAFGLGMLSLAYFDESGKEPIEQSNADSPESTETTDADGKSKGWPDQS